MPANVNLSEHGRIFLVILMSFDFEHGHILLVNSVPFYSLVNLSLEPAHLLL